MKVVTLKRKEMIPQLEAAHIGAMVRLCRAFPGEEHKEVLTAVDKVQVELSERMGTCAGYAWSVRNLIRLNARLLAIHPDELIPTYLHELAHIVANRIYKTDCGHGPLWRKVMMVLGVSDERCHRMDTSAFAVRRKAQPTFSYECMKCGRPFELSMIRHRKQQDHLARRGTGAYRCKCSGNITHNP